MEFVKLDANPSQITLNKIYETSKRLCKCYSNLTSKIHKKTFANCMKDLKRLTDRLFQCNGSNFIDILYEIGEMEHVIIALERYVKEEPESLVVFVDNEKLEILNCLQLEIENNSFTLLKHSVCNIIHSIKEWELLYEIQYTLWKEKQNLSKQLQKSIDQFT